MAETGLARKEKRSFWDNFGKSILKKVLNGLEEFCRKSTKYGFTISQCYRENLASSLSHIAIGLHRMKLGGITDRDVNLLIKMPYEYKEKYDKILKDEMRKRAGLL